MATLAQSAFVAALTANDQLGSAERKRLLDQARRAERRSLKDDRYEAWMLATAAFHQAKAASTAANVGRVLKYPDAGERNVAEAVAVAAFIKIADRFMMLPLVGAGDHKSLTKYIRQWGTCATTVQTGPLYDKGKARWQRHLTSIAHHEGR